LWFVIVAMVRSNDTTTLSQQVVNHLSMFVIYALVTRTYGHSCSSML